jgi:hypothetical protein
MNFHKINKQFDLEIFIISRTFPLDFLKYFNLSFLKLIYAESNKKNIVYFCSLSLHPRTLHGLGIVLMMKNKIWWIAFLV